MDDLYIPGESETSENLDSLDSGLLGKTPLLIGGGLFIIAIIVSGVFLFSKFSKQENKSNPMSTITAPTQSPNTGQSQVTVNGKITCVPSNDTAKDCSVIITDDKNQTYQVVNLTKDDLNSLNIPKDKSTSLQIISVSDGSGSQAVILTDINGNPVVSQNSNSTSSISPTGGIPAVLANKPTSTPAITPTLTPRPTPTPAPTNISQTVNNGESLNGKTVTISGFIVGGAIGHEACIYLGLCDHSEITVNDDASFSRDTKYDTIVIMSAAEKESDYSIGQEIIFSAIVVDANGVVTLEKVY